MRTPLKTAASFALLAMLAGCAIQQTVKPVEGIQGREICIIDNPAVRPGFVEAYKRSLAAKGYAVRQLPATAAITQCAVTSTYTAKWRWDMAMYMSYAVLKVYHQGKPTGEAVYDSQRGGANPNKFIDADRKVGELVDQLFPGGAGI
ncbi:MAG: hypothetical protein EOO30_01190 [Comamonadaceae bacterium]|nr:MAG: hypothetical protein EOO30_01190 [Comamonadaceae bacterium]